MATVDRSIVNRIIAGEFADDNPTCIVEYTNAWGNKAYGVTFDGNDEKYKQATKYIIQPKVIWTEVDGVL